MKGHNIHIGGVTASNETFRIFLTHTGNPVLRVDNLYGNSNTVNYSMSPDTATILATLLTTAAENSEKIRDLYEELTALEEQRLKEIIG